MPLEDYYSELILYIRETPIVRPIGTKPANKYNLIDQTLIPLIAYTLASKNTAREDIETFYQTAEEHAGGYWKEQAELCRNLEIPELLAALSVDRQELYRKLVRLCLVAGNEMKKGFVCMLYEAYPDTCICTRSPGQILFYTKIGAFDTADCSAFYLSLVLQEVEYDPKSWNEESCEIILDRFTETVCEHMNLPFWKEITGKGETAAETQEDHEEENEPYAASVREAVLRSFWRESDLDQLDECRSFVDPAKCSLEEMKPKAMLSELPPSLAEVDLNDPVKVGVQARGIAFSSDHKHGNKKNHSTVLSYFTQMEPIKRRMEYKKTTSGCVLQYASELLKLSGICGEPFMDKPLEKEDIPRILTAYNLAFQKGLEEISQIPDNYLAMGVFLTNEAKQLREYQQAGPEPEEAEEAAKAEEAGTDTEGAIEAAGEEETGAGEAEAEGSETPEVPESETAPVDAVLEPTEAELRLSRELEEYKKKCRSLSSDNARLEGELHREKGKHAEEVRGLKEEAQELKQAIEQILSAKQGEEEDTGHEDAVGMEEMINQVSACSLSFIGGHDNWQGMMKEVFPHARFIPYGAYTSFYPGMFKKTDLIVYNIKWNSHSLYNRMLKFKDSTEIIMVDTNNQERTVRVIYQELKRLGKI